MNFDAVKGKLEAEIKEKKLEVEMFRRARNLEFEDNRVHGAKVGSRRIHVGRLECVVRSLHDDDAVLAAGIDEDGSHATRNALDDADMRCVDAKRCEILHRRFAEKVVADLGYHHYIRAAESRCHRLIRAFSAKTKIKTGAKNGFARPGKTVAEGGEIGIRAADDRYAG